MSTYKYSSKDLFSACPSKNQLQITTSLALHLKSFGILKKTKRGRRGNGSKNKHLENTSERAKALTMKSKKQSYLQESSITATLCNARSINNKTAIIHDLIELSDLTFLVETWLGVHAGPTLEAAVPKNYSVLHCDRQDRKGGGVAICFRSSLNIRSLAIGPTESFECLAAQLSAEKNINILLIYRPPGNGSAFLDELSELISCLTVEHPRWIILGDFNVQVDDHDSHLGRDLLLTMNELGFSQAVNLPTHKKGHTLDLIFHSGPLISHMEINPVVWSDHHTIHFSLTAPAIKHRGKELIKYRSLKDVSPQHIQNILNFDGLTNHCSDLDSMVFSYNHAVSSAFDVLAPVRIKRSTTLHRARWFNSSLKDLKKEVRRLERKWRKSQNPKDKRILVSYLASYENAITKKKSSYLSQEIAKAANRPAQLFRTVDSLCNPSCQNPSINPSKELCEKFVCYFSDKVSSIRSLIQSTASKTYMPVNSFKNNLTPWTDFRGISEEEISDILRHLRQTTCDLDPGPTKHMLKCTDLFEPAFHKIVNCSLQTGRFTTSLKEGIIKPLLKKPSMDPDAMSSYRPVSNLPFLGKVIEKAVYLQLEARLSANNILDPLQSGFRKHHSCETALIQVCNDLLMARDRGEGSILILLDLSAAFDTVDHEILLNRLQEYCGINGSVLQWFRSFLTGRTQRVSLGPVMSNPAPLKFGVPQGSILSPLLFAIYMLPLGTIIQKHGMTYHCYADDTQLYLSFKPGETDPTPKINSCLAELQAWMNDNWLKLNADKTEVLVVQNQRLAPKQPYPKLTPIRIGNSDINSSKLVRSLGVLIDGELSFRNQISAVVKSAYFHLKNIAKIKHLIPPEDLPILVHAFITSRLDYCNALYVGLPQKDLHRLQLVQNAAARLLTKQPRHCHITPILRSLHWLPVQWRILFKIGLLTFKSLHNLGPGYMKDLLKLHHTSHNLRSAGSINLVTPRVRLKTSGDRAFCHAAPTLWNSLPHPVKTASSLELFKSRLKSHLFSLAFQDL